MAGKRDEFAPPERPAPDRGEMTLRVRYSECDPMGIAHHTVYPIWFEEGRTEMLRASGVTYAMLEPAGILLAVTRLELKYRLPARYDDVLTLRTRVTGGGRARIDHAYELYKAEADGSPGALLCTGESTLACLGRDGRPRPLPEWLTPGAHAQPG